MSNHPTTGGGADSLPVILLVGGFGTRMDSQAHGVPKPLVEVGGRPIIWHIMKLYAHFGHTHFILPLGFGSEMFRRYFLEYEALNYDVTFTLGKPESKHYFGTNHERDWRVTLVEGGLQTSKSGRVRLGWEFAAQDEVFVTYGDGIGDVDVNAVLAFHRAHGRLATMCGYQPRSNFGIVEADADGQVRQLNEKPRQQDWINIGFFVFNRGVLPYLQNPEHDLESHVLPQLAADGQLMMYRHVGFWDKMDTIKEAQQLSKLWADSAPWKLWTQ